MIGRVSSPLHRHDIDVSLAEEPAVGQDTVVAGSSTQGDYRLVLHQQQPVDPCAAFAFDDQVSLEVPYLSIWPSAQIRPVHL
jgi:hypothetical protein